MNYNGCSSPSLVLYALCDIRKKVDELVHLVVDVPNGELRSVLSHLIGLIPRCSFERHESGICVHIWPISLIQINAKSYSILKTSSVDNGVHIESLIEDVQPITIESFDDPWKSRVNRHGSARYKLQCALFEHACPVSDIFKEKLVKARFFGGLAFTKMFITCGGLAAIDPRAIVSFANFSWLYETSII